MKFSIFSPDYKRTFNLVNTFLIFKGNLSEVFHNDVIVHIFGLSAKEIYLTKI